MSRAGAAVIPAYLFLCLLLGGSSQGVWTNAILQLGGIAIIAWAALARDGREPGEGARGLLWLAAALLLLFLLHLVPLPPALWTALPGRALVAEGYRSLGMALPWLPVSQAPYDTLATALTLLPPLAIVIGMLRLGAFRAEWLVVAVLAGAFASILVGALQVTSGDYSWYFYRFSNFGAATGFFANSNHFGALLLVSIPLLAALLADRWTRLRNANARSLAAALGAGAAAALAVGIILNGSVAILLLGGPVALATLLLALRPSRAWLGRGLAAIGLVLVAGALAIGIFLRDVPVSGTSVETRVNMWTKTSEVIGDQWLTGSGLGTFQQAYRGYENPAQVTRYFVNHAHNDYLEILQESGIPGLLLLLAFFAWWLRRVANAWRAEVSSPYMKAASIASASLLLHSLVDYPLRSAAISAVMALCLALLAGARGARKPDEAEQRRPARHASL